MIKPILVLAAPTGGGKTDLISNIDPSIFEIVSFDSRQVYKFLEVGTSKPDSVLRNQINHYMVDFLYPDQSINTAEFIELAKTSIESIWKKEKIPIITCGTGFYLKAFLYGMYEVPEINPELKKEINSMLREERWNLLQAKDPEACVKINKNDDYRICRALEVILSGGGLWSELKPITEEGFLSKKDCEIIGFYIQWDRAELYDRINKRAKEMIPGMIEETKVVLRGYGEDCPALNSLGYNFAVENIKGKIDIEIFYELFSRSHRNYAKKQITWFLRENLLEPLTWKDALFKIRKIGNGELNVRKKQYTGLYAEHS